MERTISGLVMVAIGVVAFIVLQHSAPNAIPFRSISPQDFAGVIAVLLAMALFVERAVEVVVMVLRDRDADLLNTRENNAHDALNRARDSAKAVAPEEKAAAEELVAKASENLADIQKDKTMYRGQTKRIALLVACFFGLLASLGGVRALHSLLQDSTGTSDLFTLADVAITSALLAGGSEGIHRIANVYNSFMDAQATKNEHTQKANA